MKSDTGMFATIALRITRRVVEVSCFQQQCHGVSFVVVAFCIFSFLLLLQVGHTLSHTWWGLAAAPAAACCAAACSLWLLTKEIDDLERGDEIYIKTNGNGHERKQQHSEAVVLCEVCA